MNNGPPGPFFMRNLFLIIMFCAGLQQVEAQRIADRIEAEYSIKEISPNGQNSLIVGKVFYDQRQQTLVHKQSFPANTLLAFRDSSVFVIQKDSIKQTKASAMAIQFSIYNLILNNEISDFGLEKMGFEMMEVDEQEGKIVSKWKHSVAASGYIAITQENGKVDGVIFYEKSGKPLVKQYFREYQKVGKVYFPSKIMEIIYTPSGENKKITTHRNIKVDDFTDEAEYYNLFTDTISKFIGSAKN